MRNKGLAIIRADVGKWSIIIEEVYRHAMREIVGHSMHGDVFRVSFIVVEIRAEPYEYFRCLNASALPPLW